MYALYVLYVCIHVNYMYVFMYIFIYVKRIITSLGEWSESHETFEPSRSCPDFRSEPRDLQSNAGGRSFMENPT